MKRPTKRLQITNYGSRITNQRGFTLVGVLVAVIIAAQVVLIVARLMARSEVLLDVSRETVTATGLSREGLELVRTLRDLNWFTHVTKDEWLVGICPDTGSANHQFTIDTAMVRAQAQVGDAERAELFIHANGLWGHTALANSEPTPYERIISIDCSTAGDELQHVTVTSTVKWQGRQGQERSVVLKEQLYNWIP